MKEDEVELFFKQHRETIDGTAFHARLSNTLDCLPQPQPRSRRHTLIIPVSTLLGFLLFVLLGGYSVVMNGLASIGQVFVDVGSITPEILTTCILLVLAFLALARFAVRSYQQ